MTFDFHPEARAEFQDAAHWYEDRSPLAGDRFVAVVRATVDAIMADPLRYPPDEEGIRSSGSRSFPSNFTTALMRACNSSASTP